MPSKKNLLLILSPDSWDRNTEIHFKKLFDRVDSVWPPKFLRPGEQNPLPDENSVLLFEGGTDIDPTLYGESLGAHTQEPDKARDEWEKAYFDAAIAAGAGMIGVCRGAQLLCALSGGHIIQHVTGHNGGKHLIRSFRNHVFSCTSVHHQMMNPYVLPEKEWVSLARSEFQFCSKYRNGTNRKLKVKHLWPRWQEQEIVWFPKTKCLAIQGHPEYYANDLSEFVSFCQEMVEIYLTKPKDDSHAD